MITLRSNKKAKKVSQERGEKIIECLTNNENILLDGEWMNVTDILSVKKINAENFGSDFAKQQERLELENPKERAYIEQNNPPQLTDGV